MQVVERKRIYICIYVDVRYMCIILENIAFFASGRIATSEVNSERRIVPLDKSHRTQIVGLAFSGARVHDACTHPGSSYVVIARSESTELQTVDIYSKNAMLDYATLISFSVNITRTGPHCIPVRSSRSTLSVLFFFILAQAHVLGTNRDNRSLIMRNRKDILVLE